MKDISTLFKNNRDWARQVEEETPGFFKKLS